MSRFPEDLPQAPDAGAPDAAEQRALLALAEELQRSCPDPAASAEFGAAVRARLARPWTVWRTLESSRLARTAATLMVIVVGVAPVVALARMLPWFREDPPPIGFILPRDPPAVTERTDPLPEPPLPNEPSLASAAGTVQHDRLQRAAQSWRAAGPAAPASLAAPRILYWEAASAEELWQEFVRRCAAPEPTPVPDALAARVAVLARTADPAERRALAPWLWILGGDAFPLREASPAHAWPGAPWLSGR